eukprot:14225566-Alexandrium_andersonii.AAC.1
MDDPCPRGTSGVAPRADSSSGGPCGRSQTEVQGQQKGAGAVRPWRMSAEGARARCPERRALERRWLRALAPR